MIIVRAPFRVSLFGGGTDFESFYSKRNSTIVSFSIDKYCYIHVRTLQPYFGFKYRLSWSKIEEVSDASDLSHPSVRACIQHRQISDGLEIHTVGDLPARSGLGSSSTFTAALLAALSIYQGNSYTAESIARETIYVEQSLLKEQVGIQDQIQACHGGVNITTIFSDSSYSCLSLNTTSKFVRLLEKNLVLVYSGVSRISSDIQTLIKANESSQADSLLKVNEIAEKFAARLSQHDVDYNFFVDSLLQSWEAKRQLFPDNVTTRNLNYIYQRAISSGADCGKLLGAGGGGFFAFIVPSERQEHFCRRMQDYIVVKPNLSFTGIERVT